MDDALRRDLLRWIRADIARTTGRSYRIDLEALPVESLREVQRLLRDLDGDRRAAIERARREPWRR